MCPQMKPAIIFIKHCPIIVLSNDNKKYLVHAEQTKKQECYLSGKGETSLETFCAVKQQGLVVTSYSRKSLLCTRQTNIDVSHVQSPLSNLCSHSPDLELKGMVSLERPYKLLNPLHNYLHVTH